MTVTQGDFVTFTSALMAQLAQADPEAFAHLIDTHMSGGRVIRIDDQQISVEIGMNRQLLITRTQEDLGNLFSAVQPAELVEEIIHQIEEQDSEGMEDEEMSVCPLGTYQMPYTPQNLDNLMSGLGLHRIDPPTDHSSIYPPSIPGQGPRLIAAGYLPQMGQGVPLGANPGTLVIPQHIHVAKWIINHFTDMKKYVITQDINDNSRRTMARQNRLPGDIAEIYSNDEDRLPVRASLSGAETKLYENALEAIGDWMGQLREESKPRPSSD